MWRKSQLRPLDEIVDEVLYNGMFGFFSGWAPQYEAFETALECTEHYLEKTDRAIRYLTGERDFVVGNKAYLR